MSLPVWTPNHNQWEPLRLSSTSVPDQSVALDDLVQQDDEKSRGVDGGAEGQLTDAGSCEGLRQQEVHWDQDRMSSA